jgi:molybdopterin converting factor small subunit
MVVIIRTFIPPNEPVEGFRLGRPFEFNLIDGSTLKELIQRILSENKEQIGIMAVNGKIAQEDTVLLEGDKIDLYSLLNGG